MKKISQLIEEWEMQEFLDKLQTQGASGDITASVEVAATSQEVRITAADPAAVEPPTPAPQQAEAGSGEIDVDLFAFDLQPAEADDRARFGIDTAGSLWITARDGSIVELPNADVFRLYDFLMETIKVWHPASRRWSEK